MQPEKFHGFFGYCWIILHKSGLISACFQSIYHHLSLIDILFWHLVIKSVQIWLRSRQWRVYLKNCFNLLSITDLGMSVSIHINKRIHRSTKRFENMPGISYNKVVDFATVTYICWWTRVIKMWLIWWYELDG